MRTSPIICNLHIYPANLKNGSRILRESRSLIRLKLVDRVLWVGMWEKNLERVEEIDEHIVLHRLASGFSKSSQYKFLNILPFLIFYVNVVLFCKRHSVQVVNCHTLTVLPLGVLLKLIYRIKLIYDPHELETETNDSKGLRKVIAKVVERLFIRYVDYTIVVSDAIKQWYGQHYGLTRIEVIKNISEMKSISTENYALKKNLNVPEDHVLFIYLGALSPARGIKTIINAFRQLDERNHIVFIGFGPLTDFVRGISKTNPNVHIIPAVSPDRILQYTQAADVGIHIIPNTCLNHYYCLPNKVFEYLFAGIPFIVSNFPELKNEFANSGFAWLIEPTEELLIKLITGLSAKEIKQGKQNALLNSWHWSWQNEEKKYNLIYKGL